MLTIKNYLLSNKRLTAFHPPNLTNLSRTELGRKLDIDILKAKALIVLFNRILNITIVNHKVFLIVFQHIQANVPAPSQKIFYPCLYKGFYLPSRKQLHDKWRLYLLAP